MIRAVNRNVIEPYAAVRVIKIRSATEIRRRIEMMITFVVAVLAYCRASIRQRLGLEIVVWRQQLGVFKRKHPRARLRALDRVWSKYSLLLKTRCLSHRSFSVNLLESQLHCYLEG